MLRSLAEQIALALVGVAVCGGALNAEDNLSQEASNAVDSAVEAFMTKFDVPGLSIAIAKEGRLVLARGYGYADKERNERVTPRHRFRIASISKPITSIAVHRLVEMGKLDVEERVFGQGGILGKRYGTKAYGEGVKSITVRQLLEHTHGGWDNRRRDPMFLQPTMEHTDLIGWTLDHRPLDRKPGAGYAYSNFGYCVLGRIIEAKTGRTYEQFVRDAVLRPAGVTSMTIGGDTLDDRKYFEVVYYGRKNENPYGMRVARMDSHGGWIATPSDLVRIAVRSDGFASKPDLLSARTTQAMTKGSTVNARYARGWSVNASNNWFHGGSLPGAKSIFVRTHHGFCWAVLTNTRIRDRAYAIELDRLPWDIVRRVSEWPDGDLFASTRP